MEENPPMTNTSMKDRIPSKESLAVLMASMRKEAARGSAVDGSECCYAPWTCCDPQLLLDGAEAIGLCLYAIGELIEMNMYLARAIQDQQRRITELDKSGKVSSLS